MSTFALISTNKPSFAAVIVAAGSGSRAGMDVPKQFAQWNGKPVVRHSVEAFQLAGASSIVVVIALGQEAEAQAALSEIDGVLLVEGAATRQGSVLAGLEALAERQPDQVLIHDAARPDVPLVVLDRLRGALKSASGAIPVLPVVDSLVVASNGAMADKAERENLRRVQTPQAFRFDPILSAHRSWTGAPDAGDDAQVLKAAGGDVILVEGDNRLAKLTFAEDFAPARAPAAARPVPAIRVGLGYDVHRLENGEKLWLGGIQIDHHQGLAGHSDADVLLHALVDAILGALGEGDIGTHFPPSDPQWRGAASSRFLEYAAMLAKQKGYVPLQVDCTIICEAPKIGPHRDPMRRRIAELLGVDITCVSVKATTTERLGFTGRGEGIAAQAVATLGAST